MFTILIRYSKTKREVLILANTVEFIPSGQGDGIDTPGLLINHGVEADKGLHLSLTPKDDDNWRDVFVMNAQGQTVARYTL